MTPLRDNFPGHKYYFKISVYTGLRTNAGTKSKVMFTLSGDYEETPIRLMDDGSVKVGGI